MESGELFKMIAKKKAIQGAAPDMLESLESLLVWAIEANSRLEYQKYNGMQLGGNPEANPIFKSARKAIEKAKG
jgi:hypothetical protein